MPHDRPLPLTPEQALAAEDWETGTIDATNSALIEHPEGVTFNVKECTPNLLAFLAEAYGNAGWHIRWGKRRLHISRPPT